MFLQHIWKYETGLDYLTILWKHPTQILLYYYAFVDRKETLEKVLFEITKNFFEEYDYQQNRRF
jgi:hypothetical protein